LSSNCVLTFPTLSPQSASLPASFRISSGIHTPVRWCAQG
jgi:hypothetical protein